MRVVAAATVLTALALIGPSSRAAAQPAGETVTFTEHVAPIFYESCTTCHRPGQVAPMSLLTYEDARPWARAIRQKVVDREMPPWDADPAVGAWANDRSLSDEAIATIAAWADGGAPRGDRALQPPRPPTRTASGPSASRTRSSPFPRSRSRRRGPSTTPTSRCPRTSPRTSG